MNLIQAIIFGVIQGITEWLPISSEGMISLVAVEFFNLSLKESVFLSLWLHSGTFLAAVVYFRNDLKNIIYDFFSEVGKIAKKEKIDLEKNRIVYFLVVATFITGLVGLPLLVLVVDKININGQWATVLIGALLIITGLLQKLGRQKESEFRLANIKDASLAGLAQGLAVLPGFSRSGLISSVLLLRKFKAKEALRLNFLMSVPIVFGGEIVLGLWGKIEFSWYSLIAVLVSFIFGLVTIKYLLQLATKINFGNFCLFLGILSLLAFFV